MRFIEGSMSITMLPFSVQMESSKASGSRSVVLSVVVMVERCVDVEPFVVVVVVDWSFVSGVKTLKLSGVGVPRRFNVCALVMSASQRTCFVSSSHRALGSLTSRSAATIAQTVVSKTLPSPP